MPKHEAGTPKAIANRIKAKGLQKLRWYCQMCQKQCRDENGFKCHTMSESHQRQLLLFADNPDNYIDSFSKEFKDGFVELLSRRFGTKRVNANMVYQEYIQDRHHLHMNSTEWETLTDFIKYLGKEGVCTADQTEKGWFITYIDRDPETIQRQEALAKKEKMDKDDLERTMEFINKQVERARSQERPNESPTPTGLLKQSEDEKVEFKLPVGPAQKIKHKLSSSSSSNPLVNNVSEQEAKKSSKAESEPAAKKKKSNLEELIMEEESKKEKINRKDYWVTENIVVKIVTRDLGEKYYKKKGVVKEVQNRYAAVVKLCDSADVIKLDQAHLETVIPAIGKQIRVLNGAYRGHPATLISLDEKRFCCSIKLDKGPLKGRLVDGVQYEDISKINQDS